MPELPDVVVYLEALERHVVGHTLDKVRVSGISALKSFDPPLGAIEGRVVEGTRRLGKRLVLVFGDDLFCVVHLMVAGRLHWRDRGAKAGRNGLAVFDFATGSLVLTEASKKKRASIWVVAGTGQLSADHDRGGAEPLEIDVSTFAEVLRSRNRTLKRALTDPTIFSGIGNAYSDEILVRAGLSPVRRTEKLDDAEVARLHAAVIATLTEWTDRLRAEVGEGFPSKVTAFRPEMAVHGRYGEPCGLCATTVQRIVYASNEVNYCPSCQTEGRILADRSLSRLLKGDWPTTIEDLEERGP